MNAIVAFDLETIPDVVAGSRMLGIPGGVADVAAAMLIRRQLETGGRTDFLKPGYHQVAAIGAAVVWFDNGNPNVGLKSWSGADEPRILASFLKRLKVRPQLVSWNGSGFDLPVIRYRSLIHGISAAPLYGPQDQRQWDSYAYRYGEAHVDLMDALDGYGASPAHSLDEMAKLAGLPGKTITTGAQVSELAFAGEWARIDDYVLDDAMQTLLLFLRWQLSRGRIERKVYVDVLRQLWQVAKVRKWELLAATIGSWVDQATQPALEESAA